MLNSQPAVPDRPQGVARNRRFLPLAFAAVALTYAFFAGFRTVGDPDVGWLLATGRVVIEQHSIPSTDVFSHTAAGAGWVYPPFAGVIFYALFLVGGYAALSWLSAGACAGATALLLASEWGNAALAVLCTVAVPIVAARTAPRANLFTVVLFAAFLNLLWRHYRGRRVRLWLLPVLMIAWVNLHLGFVAGLVLLAAYAFLELFEMLSRGRRAASLARLRAAAPWLLATIPATLVNPWGLGIYRAIARQNLIMEPVGSLIGEWTRVRLNQAALYDIWLWREPASAWWWLLLALGAAVAAAFWKRHFGVALMLLAAAIVSFRYVRFQALFAAVVVVAAASELWSAPLSPGAPRRRRFPIAETAAFVLLATFAAVRIADLAVNRYYLSSQEICLFGAGASWWYPERAAAFIERERLPGRIFNDYNSGGFLTWRLPGHPVYIDGRAVPFGADLFARYLRLMSQPPDSVEWQREMEARGINTLVLTNTRYPALGAIDLRRFCESRNWAPVYLDEVSAVFVRDRDENRAWTDRLRLDCTQAAFTPSEGATRAELYNYYANAGAALRALGRDPWPAWERAQSIFAADPYLFLMKGSFLQQQGRAPEAEAEYRKALALRKFDEAWFALGQAQAQQGRFEQASESLRTAAGFSSAPHGVYQALARVHLAMNEPAKALEALDRAARESPYAPGAAPAGAIFRAQLAAARAEACWRMNDRQRALEYQEQSAAENPEDPQGWLQLARCYDALGRTRQAEEARHRARAAGAQ